MSKWKVGKGAGGEHPCHVYEDDVYSFNLPSFEQATRIVALLNQGEAARRLLLRARQYIPEDTEKQVQLHEAIDDAIAEQEKR